MGAKLILLAVALFICFVSSKAFYMGRGQSGKRVFVVSVSGFGLTTAL